MASPAVTYTFSNNATADASQVNQNFTDVINGITDGTKDLSISALTCAGNATLNANTTIGNASSDTLTVTASLASHLVPSADNTYDLGTAALGYRALYLGNGSGLTAKLQSGTLAADVVFTFPTATTTIVGTDTTDTLSNKTLASPIVTTTLKIPDGSVTVPSLAFNSDADGTGTGLYRIGANNMGFAANGVYAGDISAAGIWSIGPTGRATHVVNGRFTLANTSDSSTTTITDYAWGDYSLVGFTSASAKTINSIASAAEGTVIYFYNSGGDATFVHESGTGTGAMKIRTSTGGNIVITGGGYATLVYFAGRWNLWTSSL